MKILVITDYFHRKSHIGGGDIIARQLISGLKEIGNKVLLLCCKGENFYDINDNDVKRIFCSNKTLDKSNLFSSWATIFMDRLRLLFLIRSFRPDVLLCLQLDGLTVPTISYINSLKLNKVYRLGSEWPRIYFDDRINGWNNFLTCNTDNTFKKITLNLLCFLNKYFRVSDGPRCLNANYYIFNSKHLIDRNYKILNNTAKNIVIRNGINTDYFYPGNREIDKNNKLLYVGRLSKQKGMDILLEAMHEINKQRGSKIINLTIVGWTDKEREIYRINDLIKKLDLSNSVKLKKTIGHDEIPNIYRDHDIFIFPSIKRKDSKSHEGCPSVILEAMASGIPIVARIQKGIDEIMEDGFNCVGIYEDDPKLLSEAVIKLMNDKNLYNKIRENGIEYVNKNHNYKNMIKNVENFLIKSISHS